jgi:hypothetical protein
MIKSVEIEGELVVLYSQFFQDGGWYIEVDGLEFRLIEIPIYGGEPCLVNIFETLITAIREGEKLT